MTREFGGIRPTIDHSAFIADTAVIIGDVHIGSQSSIWFNTVVRGDVNAIHIGSRTNIQDLCILHVSGEREGRPGSPLVIGSDISVGHGVTLHGCTIEDGAFIGMNAVILDNCRIGRGAMVAAGSLLTEGTQVPPGTLWMGSPARYRREIAAADRERMEKTTASYLRLSLSYRDSASPPPELLLP